MNINFQAIGGRKFVLAVAALVAALLLEVLTKKGLTETMAVFLGGLVAAFGAANMASGWIAGKTSSAVEEEVSPSEPSIEAVPSAAQLEMLSDLDNSMRSISARLEASEEQLRAFGDTQKKLGDVVLGIIRGKGNAQGAA